MKVILAVLIVHSMFFFYLAMSSFSALISSEDLNDFISPSQACIKPVPTVKSEANDGTIQYEGYHEVGNKRTLPEATITLNDCLACSGCITSAESVLITMQSRQEVYQVLGIEPELIRQRYSAYTFEPLHRPIYTLFSIAPQSTSSLATKYGITADEAYKKLVYFLQTVLSVDRVFDIAFARDLSLIEMSREFVNKYSFEHPKPFFTSACPGWICYAEKTHASILPFISTTQSPQQMMGSLVKHYLPHLLTIPAESIYHVTVMPCYDKKLEASRSDFVDPITNKRRVDCVLTTTEIESMIWECTGVGLDAMQSGLLDPLFTKCTPVHQLFPSVGSSSGGYLHFVLHYAAHALFQLVVTYEDIERGTGPIRTTMGRNADYKEYHLFDPKKPQKGVLLRCVKAYGFRHIQNVVRKMNRKCRLDKRVDAVFDGIPQRPVIDFVEIMACPSGCINGGGQLKAPDHTLFSGIQASTSTQAMRDWIANVEATYQAIGKETEMSAQIDPRVESIYRDWLQSDPHKIQMYLHTRYHAVEKGDTVMVEW